MKEQWPGGVDNGRVKTANNRGYMFTQLSHLSKQFIDYATQSNGPVIDVGCAYGVTILPILINSTCSVIALDNCQKHLDVLLERAPPDKKPYLITVKAEFPEQFSFPENYFQAIHIAYVLQFFKGDLLKIGLQKCFNALKPGGKLFLFTTSVYFTFWRDFFLPEYEKKFKAKIEFPGEMHNQHQFLPPQFAAAKHILPNFTHVFKLEDLVKLVESFGFAIELAEYDDIPGVSGYESQGRGMIGIIAVKVSAEESYAIRASGEILFTKGNGLDQLLPAMANKYPNCSVLQIHTAIMFLLSFSANTIKSEFPKYLSRININNLTPVMYMHFLALLKLQELDFDSAYTLYCELLSQNPNNKLAILMLETVGFMTGKAVEMFPVYENLYQFHKDNPTFLGMIAFLYSHVDRYKEAKNYIAIALEKSPHDAWVQHVYAHLILPHERKNEIKFLEACVSDWPKQNRFFEGHNWMHLCVLYLQEANCNVDHILQMYKKHIWGMAKDFTFEQNNAFLTLTHLEIANHLGRINLDNNKRQEIDHLWSEIAIYAEPFMSDYFTPYLTITAILAVAKVNHPKANIALEKFRTFAKCHSGTPAKYHAWYEVGLPILEGSLAYLQGNYAKALRILEPVYDKTIVIGHSDEQRNIFNKFYELAKDMASTPN